MIHQDLSEEIRACEDLLLHGPYESAKELPEKLLAESFREFTADGRISDRAEVLSWLLNKEPGLRWDISDFEIQPLSRGLVLASYHARLRRQQPSAGSLHSSLWQWSEENRCWQLLFHQSSKCSS